MKKDWRENNKGKMKMKVVIYDSSEFTALMESLNHSSQRCRKFLTANELALSSVLNLTSEM